MTTRLVQAHTSARRVLGIVLVIAAPLIAIGVGHSNRGPLETLAWFEGHRSPTDSFGYANALYHGAHARTTEANRWHLTGYATLGTVGFLLGASLLLSTRYRLNRRVDG